MTMNNHTPAPWQVGQGNTSIFDQNGDYLGAMDGVAEWAAQDMGYAQNRANAEHVVRCVNACAESNGDNWERGYAAAETDMKRDEERNDSAKRLLKETLALWKEHLQLDATGGVYSLTGYEDYINSVEARLE